MSNTKSYWVIKWAMDLLTSSQLTHDRIESLIETLHSIARNNCVAFAAHRKSIGRTYVKIMCRDVAIYMSIRKITFKSSDDKARDIIINYILGEENEQAKKVISDIDAFDVYAEIITVIDAENGMNKDEYEHIHKLIKLLELKPESTEYKTSCS